MTSGAETPEAASPPASRTAAARGMWTLLEPLHALIYFDPLCQAALEAAGLRGFWRGYFAARSAPLGAAGPHVVTALFCSFAPPMVARALPGVWELATPQQALDARRQGAAAALRAIAPDQDAAAQLAGLLWPIVARADTGARALGAVNAALPRPDDPYEALWQAATTVRELRGDGHVSALLTVGLSGLDSLLLRAALDLDGDRLQQARGWTDDEWSAARDSLEHRGLLTTTGPAGETGLTTEGRRTLAEAERRTDLAASGVWDQAARPGAAGLSELAALLLPVARACADRLPSSTPIGMGRPWDLAADPGGPADVVSG